MKGFSMPQPNHNSIVKGTGVLSAELFSYSLLME